MDSSIPIPRDLIESAKNTYALEQEFGADADQCIEAAVSAALSAHQAQLISQIADTLQAYSDELRREEAESGEGLASGWDYVEYCSELVRKFGPPETEIAAYVPTKGDVIEIIARGRVLRRPHSTMWTLLLDTDDILDFDVRRSEPSVRVRLLDRNEDDD